MPGSAGSGIQPQTAAAIQQASPPTRARHQLHRSISERLRKHHHHQDTHSSQHYHAPSHSDHQKDCSRADRHPSVPQSAAPVLQTSLRGSPDIARLDEIMPNYTSPKQSRRNSILIASDKDKVPGLAGSPIGVVNDKTLLKEMERLQARNERLKKWFVDLTTLSTCTTRRLDETCYGVLEKLSMLQNTIFALKELTLASVSTNDGFIAESRAVLSDAQAQLDAFGQFDEQQVRVQALQDRVHGGRERISMLSKRVDVVRQKVERWERADREWQGKTRRRLKIVWGFILGLGLALVVLPLCFGPRAYAPEMPEVEGSASPANFNLESKAKAPSAVRKEDLSEEVLENSRKGAASAQAGDEVLRALDEL